MSYLPAAQTELLTSILEATRERLDASACSLATLDGAELEFRAAAGVGAREVVGLRIPLGRGIAGWVVASGQSIAIADVGDDRRFDRDTARRTGYVPTSILAVPIEGEDGAHGVIEVLDRTPGAQDLQVAARTARQAALVLGLAGARAQLDEVLDDPRLTPLVRLVAELGGLDTAARDLAAALLTALVEHAR